MALLNARLKEKFTHRKERKKHRKNGPLIFIFHVFINKKKRRKKEYFDRFVF